MCKTIVLLTALAVLVLGSSPADAAGRPTREPLSYQPNAFPAGLACDFEVATEDVINEEVATTFPPQANGDVMTLVSGRLVSRVTHVDTGESIELNASGPGQIVTHPDGSVTATVEGPSFLILLPGDVPSGPSFVVNYGRFVVDIAPDGQFIGLTQRGNQFDVCAALS